MVTLIVWMALMNITDVHQGPVLLLFSAVIMETASFKLGSVMVTMIAGIGVMRGTVQPSLSGAPAGSGNAQVTVYV